MMHDDEMYLRGSALGTAFWRPHPLMNVPPRTFHRSKGKKDLFKKRSLAKPRKSTAKWTKGRKLAQKKCARDSYRVVKPNAKTLITLCCPPNKWMPRKKKCKVPLRPHLKRVPKKR